VYFYVQFLLAEKACKQIFFHRIRIRIPINHHKRQDPYPNKQIRICLDQDNNFLHRIRIRISINHHKRHES
jgi:hypothetical protein